MKPDRSCAEIQLPAWHEEFKRIRDEQVAAILRPYQTKRQPDGAK